MVANNPLSSAPAVSTSVPSGVVPTGVSGVTAVPIPIFWDSTYANADGSTGAYRVVVGTDGKGQWVIPHDLNGNQLFTVSNPGEVTVSSLPSLPSGTNAIGSVSVSSLPNVTIGSSLPTGTNVIGHVDVDTLPNVTIGTDSVGLAKDATMTGGNAKVQVTTLPALPAGTNQIGHVVVDTQPLPSSPLAAANKVTCSATDGNVAPTGGFKHISIKNLDSTNEIIVTIDTVSTTYQPDPTTAPTLTTATTGGSLAAATYYVKYTWVTANGETKPSSEASLATTGTTSTLTVTIPALPSGVTSANIYISTSTGTETKQGNTMTTSYTQSAALVSGAALTTSNTTSVAVTNPIYLEAGESFDDYISGSALHYSAAAGSPVLKYALR